MRIPGTFYNQIVTYINDIMESTLNNVTDLGIKGQTCEPSMTMASQYIMILLNECDNTTPIHLLHVTFVLSTYYVILWCFLPKELTF